MTAWPPPRHPGCPVTADARGFLAFGTSGTSVSQPAVGTAPCPPWPGSGGFPAFSVLLQGDGPWHRRTPLPCERAEHRMGAVTRGFHHTPRGQRRAPAQPQRTSPVCRFSTSTTLQQRHTTSTPAAENPVLRAGYPVR